MLKYKHTHTELLTVGLSDDDDDKMVIKNL